MKMSLVSVLLPYRNADNTLLRCLNSVKNQLLHNELILVENQTEESPVVIEFILQNPQLNILKIKELRPGIVHALNTGLEHCRGLFIARMDADDEMLDNRLTLQSNYLILNPEIDLVSGIVEYSGDLQKNFGFFLYVQQINSIKSIEEISALRFIESPFAHPSVMFRKSAIDQPNLYKHGDFPEDYDLWLRWLQMGRKMAKIDSPVLRWHDSNGRLSRVDQRCSIEGFRQLKNEYLIRWINDNISKEKKIIIAGAGKLAKPTINQLIENQIPISGITDLKERNFLNIPFIPWKELPEPLEYFIISLVSNRGSWQIIRKDLENRGYEMMRDFILCA